MPRKTFDLKREKRTKLPLSLPSDVTVKSALDRVLRLVNVASKRYLTNKVLAHLISVSLMFEIFNT